MPTMNPPQPPSPEELERQRAAQFATLTHHLSVALLIACPTIAILPPRKLDIYTFALGGVWVASASHLTHQHTGKGVWRNVADRLPAVSATGDLPTEKAKRLKQRLEEEKRIREGGIAEEVRRAREGGLKGLQRDQVEEPKQKGLLEKVWMGGEEEGWKEKRLREEQEALDEGKGYGDLIMEQIWEVWNWGKKREDEDEDEVEGKK